MLEFDFYILCGLNPELALKAAATVEAQKGPFSNIGNDYSLNIIILNNTGRPFPMCQYTVMDTQVRFCMGQMANWIANLTHAKRRPFSISMHDDATLLPGAVADLLKKWEEVKDEKWLAVSLRDFHDVVMLVNPEPLFIENVWWDCFLFPIYYVDMHYYRIMELRGWQIFKSDTPGLATHTARGVVNGDPVMMRRNELQFKHSAQIYHEIWGGGIKSETNTDPMGNGTCDPIPARN